MSAAMLMRAQPAFHDFQEQYEGLPGPGVPNLTPRIGPPRWPEPEEEQGVGRGPGERWEHRTHNITVNPWWYLDRPYLYDVPIGGPGVPVGTELPLPIAMALNFYENQLRERQNPNGGAGAIVTVPQPRGYAQTQLRVLPHA